MPGNLQLSEENTKEPVAAVSGGKIWNPEIYTVALGRPAPHGSHLRSILKWTSISVTAVLFVVSVIILLGNFSEPSSAPETMTSVNLSGSKNHEFFLSLIMIFCTATAVAFTAEDLRLPDEIKFPILLFSSLLIMVPIIASTLLANEKEVELWASEQYGYKVSYDNLTKYGEPIPAVDAKTGEPVTIYTETVEGELVLKEYFGVPDTEAYDDLMPTRVNGVDMFMDKETGEKYIVERIKGVMVLTPYNR